MTENRIAIQVFHADGGGNCANCAGGCEAAGQGVRVTSEHIADILRERYGDKVTMEYIDMFAVNLNDYPRVIAAIKDGHDMPIITFNGHPRLSAAINLEDIVEVIKEMQ